MGWMTATRLPSWERRHPCRRVEENAGRNHPMPAGMPALPGRQDQTCGLSAGVWTFGGSGASPLSETSSETLSKRPVSENCAAAKALDIAVIRPKRPLSEKPCRNDQPTSASWPDPTSEVAHSCLRVLATFQSPVRSRKHGIGISREPAGWKACATW